MEHLPDIEKGWIAGLIDADGYIRMRPRGDGANFKLSVDVSNNCIELLHRLNSVIPEGKIYRTKRRNNNWNTSYQFIIWKQSTIKFLLESVLDYLIVKKNRAVIILKFLNLDKSMLKEDLYLHRCRLYEEFKVC